MELKNIIKIVQWGYGIGAKPMPIYIVSLPMEMLASLVKIDKRSPETRSGYQRELSSSRLGKSKQGIVGYILNQMGSFPTSTLVNIREEDGKLKFSPKDGISDFIEIGDLQVPDDVKWYLIDGQHRLEGLKKAMKEKDDLKNYPLIVSLLNEPKFNEMLIFWIVNSRAKSVDTGLVYRILQTTLYGVDSPMWAQMMLSGADRRKAVAATVVDLLNVKDNSPFQGKIREFGEVERMEHIVEDKTLTRYVAIVLSERIFADMYDEDVADTLIDYWNAIKGIYPSCFSDHESYVLLSTLGLSVMHRLFPVIYGYCVKNGDISQKNMENYLRLLLEETPKISDIDFKKPIDEEWWHKIRGGGIIKGTGEGHYKYVAQSFAEKIKYAISKQRGLQK